MTPIAKAFATETGFESANLALQCFGGHGYIREWGVEQNVRDARIAMLYEGTTGIQGLDLLARKVLGSGGELLETYLCEIEDFCHQYRDVQKMGQLLDVLRKHLEEWRTVTRRIADEAVDDPEVVGAASVNYLMYAGYVSLAYFWARAVVASLNGLSDCAKNVAFYHAKITTAEFYYEHILPRTRTCMAVMEAGSSSLMELSEEHFSF